ncbi:MAG TPA: lamin tail domain-containing protein, partial [Chitinophagaceae bacterium]
MKTLLTGLLLLPLSGIAQLSEDFERRHFSQEPSWKGDTAQWQLANGRLQSNSLIPNSSFYLSAPSRLAVDVQWEFFVQLKFNTSSLNYADIYIVSDSADPALPANKGYFVRIGNTQDEVSLYRKDSSAPLVKIIDGRDGITNHANNTLKIKITRDAQNTWSLFTDATGTGTDYFPEGNCTDSTYTQTAWFAILVRQSTSGFFQKHFFDDITAQPLHIDPPDPVDPADSIDLPDPPDPPDSTDPADSTHTDPGDSIPPDPVDSVPRVVPQLYDVIIDEIFADPSNSPGLPAYEFIELKNNSPHPFNLSGWKFGNYVRTATLGDFILAPDSFLILCGKNAAAAYQPWGATMGITNFPALKNEGNTLMLYAPDGNLIHAVIYNKKWYGDDRKSKGGWSLEMTDTRYPCAGMANWKASIAPSGGTPGRKNSVEGENPDFTIPDLLRVYVTDSATIHLVFNNALDIPSASEPSGYQIDNGIGLPVRCAVNPPLFNTVTLTLPRPLQKGKIYTVMVNEVMDCNGKSPGLKNSARFGIPEKEAPFDVVINEILFNPPSGGKEFVEIYNRSGKILDLKDFQLANRDKNGNLANKKNISAESRLLFPKEFSVITADAKNLQGLYFCREPEALIEIPVLPSYPNKSGTVVLIKDSTIIDEFSYQENYHHKLIADPKGISLERLDFNAPSQDRLNWHSAAAETGYATPTYSNSQWAADNALTGKVTVQPEVFSPDSDGRDDLAYIHYEFPGPGYIANITIFDA